MSRPSPPIHALTGVRALAATWVLMFHLQHNLYDLFPETNFLEPLFSAGYLGVDLFFVLSGFILAYNYQERFERVSVAAFLSFQKMRLARIYPVHLFVLAGLGGLVTLAEIRGTNFASSGTYPLGELPIQLTVTHAWGIVDHLSWNTPSWSISCEWFAYLCFPFLAGPLLRVRGVVLPIILATTSLLAMLASLYLVGATHLDVTTGTSLLRVAGEFVAGILLCRAFRAGLELQERSRLPWDAIAGSCVVLIVAAASTWSACRWMVFPLALLVLALAHSAGPLSRFLGSKSMQYAGATSYCLYMTHSVVLFIGLSVLPTARYADASLVARLGVFVAYLCALFAAAIATYHLVENPGRRLIRSIRIKRGTKD